MSLVPPHIESLHPYVPGKPIEEVERELGLTGVAKLASNENPLGPSPKALEAVRAALPKLHLYPDGSAFYLKRKLAEHHGVTAEEVVVGNGSNEIIDLLVHVFLRPRSAEGGGDLGLVADGSFVMYALGMQARDVGYVSVPMKDRTFDLDAMADAIGPQVKMIFVANPNNPTGTWVDRSAMERFLDRVPEHVIVVLDEAYIEYVQTPTYPDGLTLRSRHPNLVVLRTFSKIYGLAGLRCGYGIMPRALAGWMDRVRAPFNVNSLAQVAALAALDDHDHVSRSREVNAQGLAYFQAELPRLGVRLTPSACNFVLADFDRPGKEVFDALLREGVIVRPMAGYGFPDSARISIGTQDENARLVAALKKTLGR